MVHPRKYNKEIKKKTTLFKKRSGTRRGNLEIWKIITFYDRKFNIKISICNQ